MARSVRGQDFAQNLQQQLEVRTEILFNQIFACLGRIEDLPESAGGAARDGHRHDSRVHAGRAFRVHGRSESAIRRDLASAVDDGLRFDDRNTLDGGVSSS